MTTTTKETSKKTDAATDQTVVEGAAKKANKPLAINEKLQLIENHLKNIFVEREEPIHGLTLGILSDTNVFFIGPPGTGKSAQIREWTRCIVGGKYFGRLLSPTTRDDELLGPVNIKALVDDGVSKRNGKNKLQEAHTIFLDEIFKGSSAINNLLLKAMNEREIDDEGSDMPIPALTIASASNELPEPDSHREAAYDRLVLKYEIERVKDAANVNKMMESHVAMRAGKVEANRPEISLEELLKAREEVKQIELSKAAKQTLFKIRTGLANEEIYPSDRTFNICLQIAQSEAYYHGSKTVEEEHLAVLAHALWSDLDDIKTVQKVVGKHVSPEEPKIMKQHELCQSAYQAVLEINDKEAREGEAVHALSKIEDAEREVVKLIKDMTSKNKNTTKAKKLHKEIEAIRNKLIEDEIKGDIHAFEDDWASGFDNS